MSRTASWISGSDNTLHSSLHPEFADHLEYFST
jgi:hypothetical protein